MILKSYQVNAIEELLHDATSLLNMNGKKTLVFKAPTGSGKTVVMAELIKQLGESRNLVAPVAIIWAAPRKLHEQSKNKLTKYYETTRAINCTYFDGLDDRCIGTNEILFFNWESINKKNAIYIKDNEAENNLSTVLERTRQNGNKIILVIDESHFAAGTGDTAIMSAAKKLREDIAADLTVEVSATPKITGDKTVSVTIDEVKLEAMIKKSVIVNPDYKNVFKGNVLFTELPGSEKNSDELLLTSALEKRTELEEKYKTEGLSIRPLLLIQLPDRNSNSDQNIRENIEIILNNNNISESNGKLKIYLSDEKSEGLGLISKEDDETDVLIFKQGIALGWDCPRAQILVLFRQWKSLTFSVQTIGRIMRMPDPASGYYKDEILNHAYVYTNFENIVVQEDLAGGYVTINTSHRRASYGSIALNSIYIKRQREKTRLNPSFIQLFLNEAKNYKLENKLKMHNQRVSSALIKNYESYSVDTMTNSDIIGTISIKVDNEDDLQKIFNQFAHDSLMPELYPSPESVGRVKESIFYFFSTALGIHYNKKFKEVINIAISDDNRGEFVAVINNTKLRYLKGVLEKQAELIDILDWQIPEVITTAKDMVIINKRKSIMQPFLSDESWKSESAFIDYLEANSNVEWWFKNGVGESIYFALPYEMNGETRLFWPDFIIKYTDGRIGIFDPHGKQFSDLEFKAKGLSEYINTHNNIGGGIVSNTDPSSYTGVWQVYGVRDQTWTNLEL